MDKKGNGDQKRNGQPTDRKDKKNKGGVTLENVAAVAGIASLFVGVASLVQQVFSGEDDDKEETSEG